MKIELQTKIIEDFPNLFRLLKEDGASTNPIYPIAFGIECGNGWYELIYKLCEELTGLEKETNTSTIVLQVKEKYGGLRFYINGGTDSMLNVIDFAENLSYSICERCGTMGGVTQTKGWIVTLCKKCMHNYINGGKI